MPAPPSPEPAPSAIVVRPPEGLARGRYATTTPVLVFASAALVLAAIGLTVWRARRKRRVNP